MQLGQEGVVVGYGMQHLKPGSKKPSHIIEQSSFSHYAHQAPK